MDDEQEPKAEDGGEAPEADAPQQTPQDDVTGEAPARDNDAIADDGKITKLSARMDAIEAAMQELRNMIGSPSEAIEEMGADVDDYGDSDDDMEPEDITVADLFRTE